MRTNQGYEIIKSEQMKDYEVVIGYNTKNPHYPFVCWYCHNEDNYSAGMYYENYQKAEKAFNERIGKDRPGIDRPYTNDEIFNEVIDRLKDQNLYPGIIDYASGKWFDPTDIKHDEYFIECAVDIYGSEGIYLDSYLVDNDGNKIKFGTIKTLENGRSDLYAMTKLQADLMFEFEDWKWEHSDELNWNN